jgi:hypothetical protein
VKAPKNNIEYSNARSSISQSYEIDATTTNNEENDKEY